MSYSWKRFVQAHHHAQDIVSGYSLQAIAWLKSQYKQSAATADDHILCLSLTKNDQGRDFVIGDIHGCYTAVDHALAILAFNPQQDRLICVGDLLNRGDENMRALDYLNQPWFYSVLGNHDWVHAFDTHEHFESARIHRQHLKWTKSIEPQEDYQQLRRKLQQLPLMIDIETPLGLVGIVHGEISPQFDTWQEAKQSVATCTNCLAACQHHPFIHGRLRHQKQEKIIATKPITDVRMVISGHTPQKKPTWIGNSLFIDTGLVYGMKGKQARKGGLTLIELQANMAHYFPFNRQLGRLDVQAVQKTPLAQLKQKYSS